MALSGSAANPVIMGGFGRHIVRYVRPANEWGSIDLNALDNEEYPASGGRIIGPSPLGNVPGAEGMTVACWQHVGDAETSDFTHFWIFTYEDFNDPAGFPFFAVRLAPFQFDPFFLNLDTTAAAEGVGKIFNTTFGNILPPAPAQQKGWVFCAGSVRWDVVGGDPLDQGWDATVSVAICRADRAVADYRETASWHWGQLASATADTIPFGLANPWMIYNNGAVAAHDTYITGLVLLRGYMDLTIDANLNKLRGLCSGGMLGARDPTKGASPLSPALFMYGDKDQFARNRIDDALWTPSPALISGPTLRVCQGA